MGKANAQTLLPDILVTDADPFVSWVGENKWTALIIFAIALLSINIFRPWVGLKVAQFRRIRAKWAYQAMVGRRMSTRAKNRIIGERLAAELVNMQDQGVITPKDKRGLLRRLELLLELDPGDIRPKPSPEEKKRRIRGRIVGKINTIHRVVTSMSSTKTEADKVVPLHKPSNGRNRLAGIMSK